jgi:hypothetical protein
MQGVSRGNAVLVNVIAYIGTEWHLDRKPPAFMSRKIYGILKLKFNIAIDFQLLLNGPLSTEPLYRVDVWCKISYGS